MGNTLQRGSLNPCIVILGARRTEAQKPLGALRRKAHFEAQVFLSEAHHMLNRYFMIFMMVVSYFYMTSCNFLAILVDYLLLLLFYRDYRVVGRVRAFFLELKHGRNGVGGAEILKIRHLGSK